MPTMTDVYASIRTLALADLTLPGLLGATTAFYYGDDLPIAPTPPYIVMKQLDDAPNQEDSFYGDFRPIVEMHIIGADPGRLDEIKEHLDRLFTIPWRRTTVIESSTFVIRQMQRRSAIMVGTIAREVDGLVLQHLVLEWRLKLTAKA